MDILTFLRIAARRWIVTVPLLILTLIVAVTLSTRVKPAYSASGSSLLLPPVAQATPQDPNAAATGNPYVDSNPGLYVTATALMQSASQPDVRVQQAAAGHSSTYKLTIDDKSPILNISDTTATAEAAVDSVIATQDLLQRQLLAREDAAAVVPQQRITIDNLVVPEGAGIETGSKIRLMAATGILGLAAIVAGAFTAENIADRRKRKGVPILTPVDNPPDRSTSAWPEYGQEVPLEAGTGAGGAARRLAGE